MLPSLSNRFVPESTRLVQCLGIALNRDCLHAALVDNRDQTPRILNQWQASLPHAIDGPDEEVIATALSGAIEKICSEIEQPYYTVQVAMPDPLVQLKVFDLESIPASERARQEFARWRLNKDFHRDIDGLAIRTQVISCEYAPPRLMVEAIEQRVLDRVLQAARRADVVVSIVDMAARFRQGQLDQVPQENAPAALFALESTYWSLLVWDEQGIYRQLRARWRDTACTSPDQAFEKIFRQVDQQLRLFNSEDGHPKVARLWVQDSGEITNTLMTTLTQQTELDCAPVPVGQAVTDGIKSMTAVATGRLS